MVTPTKKNKGSHGKSSASGQRRKTIRAADSVSAASASDAGSADTPRHLAPLDALYLLEECWVICRTAGLMQQHHRRVSRRLGLATTFVATIASLGLFATLPVTPSDWAQTAAALVVALAAVLAAWQTKSSRETQEAAVATAQTFHTFHALHGDLLESVQRSRETGEATDPALIDKARNALEAQATSLTANMRFLALARSSVRASLYDLRLIPAPVTTG